MKKRILSLLLVFAMLFSLSTQGFAVQDNGETSNDGEQTVTVTFNANGGYFDEPGTSSVERSYPSGETVSEDFPTPEHEDVHYAFAGWFYDAECTDGPVNSWDYYPVDGQTLYAGWSINYTVTLHGNGGYYTEYRYDDDGVWGPVEVETTSLSFQKGSEFSGSCGFRYKDEHYQFINWYFDADCNQPLPSDDPYYIEKDEEFYAGWQEYCVVTFNANGGKFYENDSEIATRGYPKGDHIYGYPSMYHENEHMAFVGWYADENFDGEPLNLSEYVLTCDVTLYAKWTEGYIVTYDANGGYFWGNTIYTTYSSVQPVGTCPDCVSDPQCADAALTFGGWYLNKDCSGDEIIPWNAPCYEDVTFFAKWVPCYTVTFNANGGYFWGDEDRTEYSMKITPGSQVNYNPVPSHNNPHMAFSGWYLNEDLSGEPIGVYEYIPSDNVTFYAKWVSGVVVTFDANGGYFIGDQTLTSRTVTIAPGEPIHDAWAPEIDDTHMAFTGWYRDRACTDGPINTNSTYPTADLTLYAGWTEGYLVTFDANGGYLWSDLSVTSVSYTIAPGNTINVNPSPENSDPHLAFGGWFLNEDGSGDKINPSNYVPQGDVILYAKWIEGYVVTFHANDGSFPELGGEKTYSITVAKGSGFSGYRWFIFDYDAKRMVSGWYSDPACTNLLMNYNQWYQPTGDMTLYAKWTDYGEVHFDANGGYFYNDHNSKNTFSYIPVGFAVEGDYPGTISIDNGKVFIGWFLNREGAGEKVDTWNYVVQGDVTFYAGWAAPAVVTFDANGGWFGDDPNVTTWTTTVTPGEHIYDEPYDYHHANDHKLFTGWYLNPECTGERVNPYNYVITEDITFYAKWSDCYIITFYPGDDGYFPFDDTREKVEVKVVAGEEIGYYGTVESRDPHRTHKGLWVLEDGVTVIDPRAFVPTSDMSLYPKWEIAYSVTFIGNGGVFNTGENTLTISVAQGDPIGYRNVGLYNITPYYPDESKIFDYYSYDAAGEDRIMLVASVVPTGDLTLYANWADACHVRFLVNGENYGTRSVKPGGYVSYYNTYYNWYLDSGLTERVNPGSYQIMEDTTFYGAEPELETLQVILDLNGGTYRTSTQLTVEVKKGRSLYNSEQSHYFYSYYTTQYKNGDKTFWGWSYTQDGSQPVDLGKAVTKSMTIYAVWKDCASVTFDGNGKYIGAYVNDKDYYGNTITIPLPTEPLLSVLPDVWLNEDETGETHHMLTGWYLDKACTRPVTDSVLVSDGLTVYAKWSEAYQVRFDFNGVYDVNYGTAYSFNVLSGSAIGSAYYIPGSAHNGIAFSGFALDPAGTNRIGDIEAYVPTGNTTIYLIWTSGYTITFDGNGRSLSEDYDSPYMTIDLPIGAAIGDFELAVGPAKVNGWYYDIACTRPVGSLKEFIPNRDITVYAKWAIDNPFVDVKAGKYYYDPVLWAYYHDPQITGGTDATHFSPNSTCTRAQIVTFLWKAKGAPEPVTTENPFTDVKAGKYYFKAVLWAVENGITSGVGDGKFGVNDPCTREQAMTFLWKACGAPEPTNTSNPFTDVKSSKYYFKPVMWAVENGITSGVSADKFGVGQYCTRGQIMTFLYKAMGN